MQETNTIANPAPLGLMGFGMTTVLLNIHNAGLFPVVSMIMGMGIFFGGIAQIIAGIMEFKKGNTFGATAFTAYGSFWLTLVATWVLPAMGLAETTPHGFMGWYLFLWGLFTFGMYIGTRHKGAKMLRVVFSTLTVLFILLAVRDWTGSVVIGTIAGIEGIICGLSAMYLSIAEVLHAHTGKVVLPY